MWFFRAVAFDLDGTLTDGDRLSEAAIAAIRASRHQLKMILVTGRIFEDLQAAFPWLASEFDAVVTENGGVLHTRYGARSLAGQPDASVAHALRDRGIAARSGQVVLALGARDVAAALEVVSGLGTDLEVVRNRGAAMLLPAGVTKSTGMLAALEELGLSAHNTIAVGDAENDLALLQAAEVGAAVANAVPYLAARADLRLRRSDGHGVAELLAGPLITGEQRLCPRRRWLHVGAFADGEPVLVPGSQARILIAGDARAGRSYLAGLLAERWIDAGYAVLVIDPEGDHVGLASRPGVHLVNGAAQLPSPSDLLAIARPGRDSLVLDLSGVPESDISGYLARLSPAIAAQRARHGIPHWVIADEAHLHPHGQAAHSGQGLAEPGTCAVTCGPDSTSANFRHGADLILTVDGRPPAAAEISAPAVRAAISIGGQPSRPFTVDPAHGARTRRRSAPGRTA